VRRADPETHAKGIYKMIKNFPYTNGRMPDIFVAGRDAFQKKDRYAVNRTELTFSDIFNQNGMYLQPATTDRVIGWWVVKTYMNQNMFFYFRGYNDPGVDEITGMQTDENDVEDIKGKGNDPNVADHFCDEFRYLCMALPFPFVKKQKYVPHQWDTYNKKPKSSQKKTSVMSV
jgi:hypothetical protein